jgi:DNA polymerase IV
MPMTIPQPRIIAHFDLDSFFVSVEILGDPSLKGKPVIVGGRERGVVAACSYEARAYGIHSAMPMARAVQLCPQAVLVSGNRPEYSRFSRMVTELIASRAPLMEKASIDEFYLDLSGMGRFHDPLTWTRELRELIIAQTGLPISFGLAPNKMVAKMATNEAKPNGFLQILPGQVQEFLDPLPVSRIPGVGDQTFRSLMQLGIESIRELRMAKPAMLAHFLGSAGLDLWNRAHGRHDSPVQEYREAKSVSTENTFETDIGDEEFLVGELLRMTEKIAFEVRQDNKMAGCLTVKIRYPDFETTSRQISIPYTFYDDELFMVARDLFYRLYRKGQPVRLLGVRLSELTGDAVQTNLFSDHRKKAELYKAIDEVKNRFGKEALTKARGK